MNARKQNLWRLILSLLTSATALSSTASAADFTWNGQGENDDWSTGENWQGGLAPTSDPATALQFIDSPRLNPVANSPWTLGSMTFASDAGPYTLSGATLTLASGGSVTNSSNNLQTIANSDLVLGGASTWNTGGAGLNVSSAISGAGSITKTGAGTLFLSSANTYTGGTTISAGVLDFASSSLGSGPITVNGGWLRWASGNSDALSGTITVSGSGGTLDTNGNDVGLGAALSATGMVSKAGEGVLTLNAAGVTNGVTVNGGTLRLGTDGAITGGKALVVNSTGDYGSSTTFDLNGHDLTVSSITFGSSTASQPATVNTVSTGGGTLTVGGNINYRVVSGNTDFHSGGAVLSGKLDLGSNAARTIRVDDSVNTGAELTISADISSGAGSGITKTGDGTLVLSGNNTYSGNTVISGGALRVESDSNLPTTTNVQLNGGVLELAYDRVLTYGTGAGQIQWTGSGGFSAYGGDRVLNYEGGAALTWGASNFVGNAFDLYFGSESSDSMVTMTNNINMGGSNRGIDVSYGTSAETDATLSGVLSNGGLNKTGWGVLRLTGSNTYTGRTTISGGYLNFGTRASLYNANTSLWTANQLTVYGGAIFSVGGAGEFTAADIDLLKTLGTSTRGFLDGSSLGFDTTNAVGGNFTYSSVIGDTNGGQNYLGIDKFGAGTLELAGANTYTGVTSVWIGTLKATNSQSLGAGTNVWEDGTYVVEGGSLLLENVAIGNERVTMYGHGVNENGTIRSTGVSSLAGDVELAGDSSINVEDGNLTLTGAVTGYNLTKIGAGTLTLAGNTGNDSLIIVEDGKLILAKDSAYAITYDLTINNGTAQISGDDQIGEFASVNVYGGGLLDLNGHDEGFSRLSGSGLVTNTASGSHATLTLGQNDGYSDFSGLIEDGEGVVSIVKTGAEWLDLMGANSYSGGTTLDGGGLGLGNARALGSGPLTINAGQLRNISGGDLTLDDVAITVNGDFNVNGDSLNLGRGAVTLTGDRTIFVDENTLTIGGAIGDGGNGYDFTKAGVGLLVLDGANTYTGSTILYDGILGLGSAGALGGTADISFSGGVLQFSAANTTDYSARFSTEDGQWYRIDTNGQSVTLAGALTSAGGSLDKLGAGTLTLAGANSYTGNTEVIEGTLSVTNASGLGLGATDNWTNIHEGATLRLDNVDIGDEWLVVGGSGVGGNGALTVTGSSSSSGQVNFGTDASVNVAGALTFTGAVFGDNFVKEGAGSLTLGGAADNSGLTGTINAGLLILAKDSSSDVHAIGYGLTIRDGATARLAGTGGDQIYNEGNVQIDEGGTLDLNGRSEGFAALTGSGVVTNTAAATTSTVTVGEFGASATFAGRLQDGAGILALAKNEVGEFTLTGSNTFTGGTTLRDGVLILGSAGALGTTGTIGFQGGTLRFTEENTTDYSARFSSEAGQQFNIDTNGQSVTLAGNITSEDGRLNKLGAGTLILSGTNHHAGGIFVDEGVLVVLGDNSATGETTVGEGGTLGGTGRLGDVVVQAGGALTPGTSPGLLTIEGDLTMQEGSLLVMEFSGTSLGSFDQVSVQDIFTAGGTLSLQVIDGFNPMAGDSFLLFTAGGFDAGDFSNITTNLGDGLSWDVGELATTGKVTVVPEPSVAALAALGLSGLLLRGRNRRRCFAS